MKRKRIILISSIILILIAIIIGIYLYLKNDRTKEENATKIIEAEVLVVGDDYLLVTTEDQIDYIINTEDLNYQIGDNLKLELIDIKEENSPIEATSKKITILNQEKEDTNSITEDQQPTTSSPTETNPNPNTTTPSKESTNSSNNSNNNTEQNYTEEEVVNYFTNLDTELSNYTNDNSLGKTIKEKFVKGVDFIFYDGEIGGKTFDELTNSAKLKIIKLTLSIDNKIDSKFPGYKDSISSTYQNIKNKLVEKYLDITTSICEKDEQLCKTAKEGFQDLKKSFNITWDLIKELAGSGITKLKNWYEIWRYQ